MLVEEVDVYFALSKHLCNVIDQDFYEVKISWKYQGGNNSHYVN